MLLQPVANPVTGSVTGKAGLFFSVDKQHDGGKATQLIFARQLHVFSFIDFNFYQAHLFRHVIHDPLQVRGDSMTRRTPVRPEIDHNGTTAGSFNNDFLKVMEMGALMGFLGTKFVHELGILSVTTGRYGLFCRFSGGIIC